MKRVLAILVFAVALVTAGGGTLAETIPHPGVVKSVDPATKIVVLEDGLKFRAGEGVEVDSLRPGTRVIIYYYDTGATKLLGSYEFVTN